MLRVRRRRDQGLGEQQRRAVLRRRPRAAAPLRDRRAEVRGHHLPQRARRAGDFSGGVAGWRGKVHEWDGYGFSTGKEHHFFDVKERVAKGLYYFAEGFGVPCDRRRGCSSTARPTIWPSRLRRSVRRGASASRSLSWCSATRCSGRRAPTTTCGTRRRIHRSRSLCRSTRRRSRGANWDNTSGFGEWSDSHVRDLFVAGLYDEQLNSWADAVGKDGQIVVLSQDDFFAAPAATTSSAPSTVGRTARHAAQLANIMNSNSPPPRRPDVGVGRAVERSTSRRSPACTKR